METTGGERVSRSARGHQVDNAMPRGRKAGWLTAAVLAASVLVPGSAGAALEEADLEISKTADPNPVQVGQEVTYTVIIKNLDQTTATDVLGVDILPEETKFVRATPGQGGPCVTTPPLGPGFGTRIECPIGDIGPGGVVAIIVTALVKTLPADGLINNRCSVFSDNDPHPNNDHFSLDTTVTPAPAPPPDETLAGPTVTEKEKKKCKKKKKKNRKKCLEQAALD